jgi:hypothetical protein
VGPSSNYYASNTDIKQHQAYRSLLQSVTHTSLYQGVKEQQTSPVQKSGWKYLSMINNQHVLLEKKQALVLLSVDLLIKQKIIESKELETKSIRLMFPEKIDCVSNAEASIIAEKLGTQNVKTDIVETQITVFSIPSWMEGLTIRICCLELFFIELNNEHEIDRNRYLSEQAHAEFILTLLLESADLEPLQLKTISFDTLLRLFSETL